MKLTLAGYGVLGDLGLPNPFTPPPALPYLDAWLDQQTVKIHTKESWEAYLKQLKAKGYKPWATAPPMDHSGDAFGYFSKDPKDAYKKGDVFYTKPPPPEETP